MTEGKAAAVDRGAAAKPPMGDRALTNPAHDELGAYSFAERVARIILHDSSRDGLVVSVNACWGMGKTTALNFIAHCLEQVPEGKRPVVVRFNPWWYEGEERLLRGFFEQLRAAVDSEREEHRKLRQLLLELAKLLVHAPSGWVSWVARAVSTLFGQQPRCLEEVKMQIAQLLDEKKLRIVVFIDEIDRLERNETALIFRLIKAVADFPGVIYVLAFERSWVAREIEGGVCSSGVSYLDKIIQLPLELPLPETFRLQDMFTRRLDMAIRNVPQEDFDRQRWMRVFLDGIAKLVTTPRDVVKVTNAVRISLPAIVDEVDVVDFIALEVLRVRLPDVYAVVRDHPDEFAGGVDSPLAKPADTNRLSEFHAKWLKGMAEAQREASQAICSSPV
jgi:predicted KAP-like P-loop ATPase